MRRLEIVQKGVFDRQKSCSKNLSVRYAEPVAQGYMEQCQLLDQERCVSVSFGRLRFVILMADTRRVKRCIIIIIMTDTADFYECKTCVSTKTNKIIIISFSSPTLSFIPDLKPSFSANPSHCSLCLLQDWLHMIPQTFTVTYSISVFTF